MRSKSRAKMDEIAAFANQYYLAHGHSPSTTAIAAHVGMARGTAYKYLAEMNRLGILIDVSHLSDGGFRDVAEISKKPFVASHSNCRAICSRIPNTP